MKELIFGQRTVLAELVKKLTPCGVKMRTNGQKVGGDKIAHEKKSYSSTVLPTGKNWHTYCYKTSRGDPRDGESAAGMQVASYLCADIIGT
jgi:hypothetical protein